MTKPEFKFDLNFGTLIPLAAMAIALAVAWGKLTGSVDDMEARLTKMETAASTSDTRLRSVETGQSNMTVRLEGIKESLDELKASQRETNVLLREMATGRRAP
jgi:hypothetical protein